MYKQTSLFFSVLLIGSIAATMPAVAQVEFSVSPKNTQQIKDLLQRGRSLVDARDYNNAIAIYQQAASLEPKNGSIYSGIGYSYAALGNFPQALTAYRRAVALDPNNGDYQYALGYISGNLGENLEAKEAYRRAIQSNRNNANAYIGLGTILVRLGQYSNAVWACGQAISLSPTNPQAYELRGAIFLKQGKSAQAIPVFKKARDLYERQGKMDNASRVETTLRHLGA